MACSGERPASARFGPASLQHLPHEVLLKILRRVVEAAAGEHRTPAEARAWQESFLVPLRSYCIGLRDAADLCLTSCSLSMRSNSSRDASMLIRISDWLCHSHNRWPHLTALQLSFDFPGDYLQFTLLTIARSCTSLARIKLKYSGSRDYYSSKLEIGVLGSLPSLSALSVHGFARYSDWSEGLAVLTSVQELELVYSGLREFESWPALTSLMVDGAEEPSQRKKERFKLRLGPDLRDLCISRLTIDNLELPSSMKTLELSEVFCFSADFDNLAKALLSSVKLRDMDCPCINSLLAQIGVLRTLEVTGLKNLNEDPLPDDMSELTSLVWSKNNGELPPTISTLTELEKLVLSGSDSWRIPTLAAMTRLQSLSISEMTQLFSFPDLRTFTRLSTLNLSSPPGLEMPHGFSALVALEELSLEGFDILELPKLYPLSRLHSLTLRECNEVSSLSELQHFTSLHTLHLSKMKRLNEVANLSSSLTSLSIALCPNLRRFPVLPPVNSLRQLTVERVPTTFVSQVTALASLQKLTIQDFPDLHELPRLQSLGLLKSITVASCPLVRAIDVRQLTELRLVGISSCKALESVKGLAEHIKCTINGCHALRSFNG